MTINIVARFATRATELDGTGPVDLILGGAMKTNTVLKANTIYEIQEIMESLVVVEIGPSAAIIEPDDLDTPKNIWACGLNMVVECYRDRWLLTLDEWHRRMKYWQEQAKKVDSQ